MNKELVKKYLEENPSVAVEVARECNSWDGSFPEFDTFYIPDFVDCMCYDHESTLRVLDDVIYAAEFGEFNNHNTAYDTVRYNDLGQLEVRSDYELEEEVVNYIDEIVDKLEEEYPAHIDIYDDDLKELLDSEELDLEELESDTYDVAREKYKESEINADVLVKIASDVFCVDDTDLKAFEKYLVEKEKTYVEE